MEKLSQDYEDIEYSVRQAGALDPFLTQPYEMPYIGTSEPEPISNLDAREFIGKGGGGYVEILSNIAKLAVISTDGLRQKEIGQKLSEIAAAKRDGAGEEKIQQILDNTDFMRASGYGDFLAALNKARGAAERSTNAFGRLAAEQNPLVAKLKEISRADDGAKAEEFKTAVAAWGWSKEIEKKKGYTAADLAADLAKMPAGLTLKNKEALNECYNKLEEMVESGGPKTKEYELLRKLFKVPTVERVFDKEEAAKLRSLKNDFAGYGDLEKYDEARKPHDEAAAMARLITRETFYKQGSKRINLADSIPLVTEKEGGGFETSFSSGEYHGTPHHAREITKKAHFNTMLKEGFRKMMEHDDEFVMFESRYPGIKERIFNSLQQKLFSENPDQDLLAAIYAVDYVHEKIEPGVSPSRRQEEQLGKIIEDTIYNEIMRENGGLQAYASIQGFEADPDANIIDVRSNAQTGLYYIGKGSPYHRAFDEAKQAAAFNKLIQGVSSGRVSASEFDRQINRDNFTFLNEQDCEAIRSIAGQYYVGAAEKFKATEYGISEDQKQRSMDANSYMYQRDARDIHKRLFEDSFSSKALAAIGLEKRRGQDFMRCLNSARNATIKTHSSGHETKQCMDNLIREYEQDAKDVVQNISNPLMAMGGLSGLMLIFSIMEKAQARQLKHMTFMMEAERTKKLAYVNDAKTPQETLAYMNALKLSEENITSTIVDKNVQDGFVGEQIWANHQYSIRFNPYLRVRDIEEEMRHAIESNEKAKVAHDLIRGVLADAGVSEDFVAFMKEDFEATKASYNQSYSELLQRIEKQSRILDEAERAAEQGGPKEAAQARKERIALIAITGEMTVLKAQALKDGIFGENVRLENVGPSEEIIRKANEFMAADTASKEGKLVNLASEELRKTSEKIEALAAEVQQLQKDISSGGPAERIAASERLSGIQAALKQEQDSAIELKKLSSQTEKVMTEVNEYLEVAAKSVSAAVTDYTDRVQKYEEIVKSGSGPRASEAATELAKLREDAQGKWMKASPFAPSYRAFEEGAHTKHAFSNKYRGKESTAFFTESLMGSMDRYTKARGGKNAKIFGSAMSAARTVFAEMAIQQAAMQTGKDTREAFKEMYKKNRSMTEAMSNARFFKLEQEDPSKLQIITTNKAYDNAVYAKMPDIGISMADGLENAITTRQFRDMEAKEFRDLKDDFLKLYGVAEAEVIRYKESIIGRKLDEVDIQSLSQDDYIAAIADRIGDEDGNAASVKKTLSAKWHTIAEHKKEVLVSRRNKVSAANMMTSAVTGINIGEMASRVDGKDGLYEAKVDNRIDLMNFTKHVQDALDAGRFDTIKARNSEMPLHDSAQEERMRATQSQSAGGGL